jgi:hypothetical protein
MHGSKPLMLLWWTSVVAAGACSAEAPGVSRYDGLAVVQDVPWGKGHLAIVNRNGNVKVDTAGQTGQITAVGLPFALATPDESGRRTAADAIERDLHLDVTSDGAGGVTVKGGGSDTEGFDLTVHLPYPFSSLVSITITAGNLSFVGSSGGPGADIEVGTGDVFVQDGGGLLTIKGGLTNVTVIALPTMVGTSIVTDTGDITAQIPDAANLLITATTAGGGTVTPPPNKSVVSDDSQTQAFHARSFAHPLAVSNLGPGNKSATIQLGNPAKAAQQTLRVATGNGNIVFR